jgi:hypothetical protein
MKDDNLSSKSLARGLFKSGSSSTSFSVVSFFLAVSVSHFFSSPRQTKQRSSQKRPRQNRRIYNAVFAEKFRRNRYLQLMISKDFTLADL